MQSNSPLVSIGIPTYNRPNELKIAIESIVNQKYNNLEIIVSDNCSSDPAVEKLCKNYANIDSRIKYYRQDKNIGMAQNCYFIINKAIGDYFIWCLDDDWLSKNYIEESLKVILKDPGCSIVFGNMNFYNTEYQLIKKCPQVHIEQSCYVERMLTYCSTAISSSLTCGLVSTKTMREVYTNNARLPEDWIFMMKILFLGKGRYLPSVSYNALNNGVSKNIESLKKGFNLPLLNEENFWDVMNIYIFDSILHDDFYTTRLETYDRISLALDINKAIMHNKASNAFFYKIRNKLKKIKDFYF